MNLADQEKRMKGKKRWVGETDEKNRCLESLNNLSIAKPVSDRYYSNTMYGFKPYILFTTPRLNY